jgi:hypothetical protein
VPAGFQLSRSIRQSGVADFGHATPIPKLDALQASSPSITHETRTKDNACSPGLGKCGVEEAGHATSSIPSSLLLPVPRAKTDVQVQTSSSRPFFFSLFRFLSYLPVKLTGPEEKVKLHCEVATIESITSIKGIPSAETRDGSRRK